MNAKPDRSRFSDGWLIIVWFHLVFTMCRFTSIHNCSIFLNRESHTSDFTSRSRFWLQDTLHLLFTISAILIWLALPTSEAATQSNMIGFRICVAFAIIRCFDIFWDLQMLAIFGNKYGAPWMAIMSRRRVQRTIVIQLLVLIQIVLWFAIIWWGCKLLGHDLMLKVGAESSDLMYKADALQLAFSTPTTIGYGAPAPRTQRAVVVCMVQFGMSLLLFTGMLPNVLSKASSSVDFGNEAKSDASVQRQVETTDVAWFDSNLAYMFRFFTCWIWLGFTLGALYWILS